MIRHCLCPVLTVLTSVVVLAGNPDTSAAQASTVSCHSLDMQVRLNPTREPECYRGQASQDDFRGTWEHVFLQSGDLVVVAELLRAGTHSSFYRPTLESSVESVLWTDVEDVVWMGGVANSPMAARHFRASLEDGDELACIGFLKTGGNTSGSEVKSAMLGAVCSLSGTDIADADGVEILNSIGY